MSRPVFINWENMLIIPKDILVIYVFTNNIQGSIFSSYFDKLQVVDILVGEIVWTAFAAMFNYSVVKWKINTPEARALCSSIIIWGCFDELYSVYLDRPPVENGKINKFCHSNKIEQFLQTTEDLLAWKMDKDGTRKKSQKNRQFWHIKV